MWPIFVISLSDCVERRAPLVAALNSRELTFEIIEAVDGRFGLPPDYEPMVDRPGTLHDFGRQLSDAEYACALSHLSVYRRILDDDLPGAVVLEDDAVLTPLFDVFLAAKGFQNGDLIQLDHLHGDAWRFSRRVPVTSEISLVLAAANTSLTTGYTISRRGAVHFLENALPLTRPADWPVDTLAIGAKLALPRVVDHPPPELDNSIIHATRPKVEHTKDNAERMLRFFKAAYWKRWLFKRRTRRVS